MQNFNNSLVFHARSSSLRTTVLPKQSARVFRNRFLGSVQLLQGPLLAYPLATGAAMVAVAATASSEVSQMAPGQVHSSICFFPAGAPSQFQTKQQGHVIIVAGIVIRESEGLRRIVLDVA